MFENGGKDDGGFLEESRDYEKWVVPCVPSEAPSSDGSGSTTVG